METLALVAPSPQLGDGNISLSPITMMDGDEIIAIGDVQGFVPLLIRASWNCQATTATGF
jgi:hypothetical protein